MKSIRFLAFVWMAAVLLTLPGGVLAQSVQPAIVEYGAKADGKFSVTNNTASTMTVVLEPKSFSISPDGHGTFRTLDPGIKVELSTMSVRLQPMQTYTVFYKASAERAPAWFTIYSTFIPVRKGESLNVRFQLPHTVYLYQKTALAEGDVQVMAVKYSPDKHLLECDLKNTGDNLGRAQDVQIAPVHGSPVLMAGFPLLPGAERHLAIPWEGDAPPTALRIRFPHFTLKPTIALDTAHGKRDVRPDGLPAAEEHAVGQ
ncbi:MAG: hypothetical protein ACRYF4_07565 [Janthinobacterium lividum]